MRPCTIVPLCTVYHTSPATRAQSSTPRMRYNLPAKEWFRISGFIHSSLLYKLHSLDALVGIDAGRVVARTGTVFLGKSGCVFDIVFGGTVKFFFENGLLINCLELGLEVIQGLSATVGSSAGVVEVVARVFSFIGQGTLLRQKSD